MSRLARVKLTEIPYDTRMAAARHEAKRCEHEDERTELVLAAMFPSDTVYYVSAEAERLTAAA